MKAKELRDLTYEELTKKADSLQAELFNLRFRLATGQLDNPMVISATRKDLARVKTCLLYTSGKGRRHGRYRRSA